MNPKVLISILNWFNFEDTIIAVHSVLKSDYDNYEIIIIDNNSQNESVEILRNEFPKIKIIASKKNLGYAGGHKLAVKYGVENDFELIWILNNDLIVDFKCLTQLIHSYKKNGLALYGSLSLDETKFYINFASGHQLNADYSINFSSSYNELNKKKYNDVIYLLIEKRTSDVNGCSLLIPMEVIRRFGFMNVNFFLYAEETDYCYYLNKKDIYSLIVPSSIVIHKGSGSLNKSPKLEYIQQYYRVRNYNLMANKHRINHKIFKNETLFTALVFVLKYNIKKYFQTLPHWYIFKYFTNLGKIHAYFNIYGKYFEPNNYI